MFVWTSGFQNPLAHTHFNMFVDEWTSANESPELSASRGGAILGGVCPGKGLADTPPVNRMTDRCKNITLPQ